MHAADAIKKALDAHTTSRGADSAARKLVDEPSLLGRFIRHVMLNTRLAFTVFWGGSHADLCHLFISANDVGLVLSDYDIIKANIVLGGSAYCQLMECVEGLRIALGMPHLGRDVSYVQSVFLVANFGVLNPSGKIGLKMRGYSGKLRK